MSGDNGEYIAVNFTSGTLNYPIPCKLNYTFSRVENEFYLNNPEYKKEKGKYYFIANGIKLESNKALAEQGIKDRDNILINEFL